MIHLCQYTIYMIRTHGNAHISSHLDKYLYILLRILSITYFTTPVHIKNSAIHVYDNADLLTVTCLI